MNERLKITLICLPLTAVLIATFAVYIPLALLGAGLKAIIPDQPTTTGWL